MSALREAAHQVLEALGNALDAQSNPARREFPTIHDFGQMRRAHTALRAALAQQEQEQEPVAVPREWRTVLRKLTFMARTSGGAAGHDSGLSKACDEAEALLCKPYTYTHPPRREWQSLTADAVFASDEIMAANASLGLRIHQLMDLVRAVEQALKEKNHG